MFHISEEPGIPRFVPRPSKPMWGGTPYVWAIAENKVHNYLFPRDCPRICLALDESFTKVEEVPISGTQALVYLPESWKRTCQDTQLYRYEFDPQFFHLMDEIAGYYASERIERPLSMISIPNPMAVLADIGIQIEFRQKEELYSIRERVLTELTHFSIIRWGNM